LQAQQVEDRRWKLLEQLLVVTTRPGFGQLADTGREVLADAGYRSKLLFVELHDGLGPRGQRFRCRPVCPYLEGIVAPNLEKVGDFSQNL
jgi:hypothetical protein